MTTSSASPKPSSSSRKGIWIVLVLLILAGGGILIWRHFYPPLPDIPFAEYGDNYDAKPDFAEVEYKFPLSSEQLMSLTPEILKAYDQEQVDQIYARLTAGPIPDGSYDGDLFFAKGISGKKRLGEIIGGLKGAAANLELDKLTLVGRALWKGKVFYREERVLRNRINDLGAFKRFFPNPDDAKTLDEETNDIKLHPTKEAQYFPAKLYCGQSLMDSRRESIIIDYAFTDELPGYRPVPDKLAGREGLIVRDEIRMVRPGFYLGRAYMGSTFILNFTLYNKAVADAGSPAFLQNKHGAEDCWVGLQQRAALP